MKKLPQVSRMPLKKDISNNQTIYYQEKNKDNREAKEEISLNDLFNSTHHYYKVNVLIKTKDKLYDTKIIGKTDNYIITLDNDSIKLSDIISIAIKKSP